MNNSVKSQESKYTEDWIPVKAIENGMIILDNKMRVCGVKIRPRNIFILDQGTQDNVIIALKNFYNTIDFEFLLYFFHLAHMPLFKLTPCQLPILAILL